MCGLVTIFAYHSDSPLVSQAELLTIRDHMIARGPDGCGAWISGNSRVGMGHRRLAIIDTSNEGLQPMASADEEIRLVFNGEIYNFQELRLQLKSKGHTFRSKSDTEVLIAGWREWGEGLVDRLRGMYAFVIWDEAKQGIFIARDPFGIKPLYIADDGKTLRIASQVKALVAGGAVDTSPNPAGHVGFFLWGNVPSPHTLYRGIIEFNPGVARWITLDGRGHQRKFANIPDMILQAQQDSESWSDEEVRTRLIAAVEDSVQKHLVADVPVGVFLSAGIDSCALASVASQISQSPIHTLTLGFREYQGTSQDETILATQMAKTLKTVHETRWVRKQDFESDFNAFIAAMDQPTQDGLNIWFVCKVAGEAGLKVALSGLGGDEFLGGYPSFKQIPDLVHKLQRVSFLSPSLGRALRQLVAPWLGMFTSGKYASLIEYGTNYAGAYLLRRALYMPWDMPNCLPAEWVRDGLPQLLDELYTSEPNSHLLSKGRVSSLESTIYMRNQLLRDADWASMAHSIELRVPLVDMKFLAASTRANKQSLAQAPRQALPDAIARRPKSGFSVPVRDWVGAGLTESDERGLRGWSQLIYKRATA